MIFRTQKLNLFLIQVAETKYILNVQQANRVVKVFRSLHICYTYNVKKRKTKRETKGRSTEARTASIQLESVQEGGK